MYFLRKVIFHFLSIYFLKKIVFHIPSKEKISYFRVKKIPSLQIIQNHIPVLERPVFQIIWIKYRSIYSQLFFKIDVLKNFANFTGKHLCWSFFWINLKAGPKAASNFIKNRLRHRCFLVKFANFSRTPVFTEQPCGCFWK